MWTNSYLFDSNLSNIWEVCFKLELKLQSWKWDKIWFRSSNWKWTRSKGQARKYSWHMLRTWSCHKWTWGLLVFHVLSKIKSIKRCFRTWEKLYTSIWGVQDFFRSPLGMYEPEKFKIFEESVNKIIETFKNYKLGLVIWTS